MNNVVRSGFTDSTCITNYLYLTNLYGNHVYYKFVIYRQYTYKQCSTICGVDSRASRLRYCSLLHSKRYGLYLNIRDICHVHAPTQTNTENKLMRHELRIYNIRTLKKNPKKNRLMKHELRIYTSRRLAESQESALACNDPIMVMC